MLTYLPYIGLCLVSLFLLLMSIMVLFDDQDCDPAGSFMCLIASFFIYIGAENTTPCKTIEDVLIPQEKITVINKNDNIQVIYGDHMFSDFSYAEGRKILDGNFFIKKQTFKTTIDFICPYTHTVKIFDRDGNFITSN